MTINNLNEIWKKGELEEGYYYLKDNKYTFIDYFNGISFKETCDFEIKEVLAEVPDYIEWKNYVTMYNYEHEENKLLKQWVEVFNALNVAQENQKLKELLKESRGCVEVGLENARMCESYTDTEYFKGLLTKIDEVLK